MLSEPSFENDDWNIQPARLYRAASVGSWGVTSIGRGFAWDEDETENRAPVESAPLHKADPPALTAPPSRSLFFDSSSDDLLPRKPSLTNKTQDVAKIMRVVTNVASVASAAKPAPSPLLSPGLTAEPYCYSTSPATSRSPSPIVPPRPFRRSSSVMQSPATPSTPRPRRRSSQQRISLVAGRVMIAPIQQPDEPSIIPKNLSRADSSSSLLSLAASTRPPSRTESFLGDHSISDFQIDGELGRGAYGLVKRAREIKPDGSLGSPVVIKQIIKSRILADCWKKHPKLGTIPIEIYVMSSISNTSYVLPPRRPWDPSRLRTTDAQSAASEEDNDWIEGKIIKGHPNICPLLDFFEDNHYYYLVLPSSTPVPLPGEPSQSSDLFDLVESYPQGLPATSIRTYLGQIADALYFLHSHGIVHRDIKDENVVLGANGRCILIDFGSSGLVKKSGWDTFSGTLDYAGPEILRGERYYGKEQDVWAFGVVAYVLLVGECPFMTAAEAQEGLESPFANASIALDERCDGKEDEELDGGGGLDDAAALVRACLKVQVSNRPTFEQILQCRFLAGREGWTQFRTE